jgi:hypothetical protein
MATLSQPSMAAERTSSRGKADGVRRAARVQSSHSVARAEVYRLTEELHRLAIRQAWSGVERTWRVLHQAEGLAVRDFLAAADAATQLGDVGAARLRLLAALDLEESRDVVERLWAIDSAYGAVTVSADGPTVLQSSGAHFFPVGRLAIERAQARLAETGRFEGWLPIGHYRVGGQEVEVRPGPHPMAVEVK